MGAIFIKFDWILYFQQAHFTDAKLYEIMSTGSDVYVSCQSGRGEYPTGGTMGKAFCLFDKLGYVSIKYKNPVGSWVSY